MSFARHVLGQKDRGYSRLTIAYEAGAAWLSTVVEELKASGFVAGLIERYNVTGLSVAGPA